MRALKSVPFILALASLYAFAQESATPNQQKSTIYVYRYKQFVGSALAPSVYCDEVQLARMENGRYFALSVDPGQHNFRSNDAQSGIQLDTKPGQEYFIRVEIATGFMKGHGRLVLTSPEQGRYELQTSKLKPLDADKVSDRSRVSLEEAKFDKPLAPAPAATPTATSTPKTATPAASTPETGPVNEVTLSDNAPDANSDMSLGDAARKAKQKKALTSGTTSPQ
jgi:hypothetical protein